MPTVDDFPDYPKGTVSLGSGDLIDVFNWSLDGEDGEKVVATIRANPGGSTYGTRSVKLMLDSAISHAGFERDWWGNWLKRTVLEARLKVPGITFVQTGRITTPKLTGSVDDYVKFNATILGKVAISLG